jgi:hypothetical protein
VQVLKITAQKRNRPGDLRRDVAQLQGARTGQQRHKFRIIWCAELASQGHALRRIVWQCLHGFKQRMPDPFGATARSVKRWADHSNGVAKRDTKRRDAMPALPATLPRARRKVIQTGISDGVQLRQQAAINAPQSAQNNGINAFFGEEIEYSAAQLQYARHKLQRRHQAQ